MTGTRYESGQTITQIAQIVRKWLKENYPAYKCSVTTKTGMMADRLTISLMEGPIPFWTDGTNLAELTGERVACYAHYYGKSTVAKEMRDMAEKVDEFVKSYRYDNSDVMHDYSDTNFYFCGLEVGKWDKPYQVKRKEGAV